MGLLNWLVGTLFGGRKRDVSRLQPAEADGEMASSERVDTSSGPFKPGHRRLAIRDPRLLPKIKAVGKARAMVGLKRRKIMSKEEGASLFGATQRTTNRQLRDLLTDPAQLERYGLPRLESEDELAAALGLTLKQLWFFSSHRLAENQPHYIAFSIPKRSGGKRTIMAPKRRLKAIQRRLIALLVSKLPVSEQAHAFRTGRSIRTGAEPHVGQKVVLKLDLKDFFPSITVARVRGYLISLGYSFPVANRLAVLMTEAERQPVATEDGVKFVPVGQRHCVQGAPTSPGLCNAIVLKLDRRLAGLARKCSLQFTRYADDLTFSGDAAPAALQRFRAVVTRIIREEGFEVNLKKTRIMRKGARQSVTGVTVNQDLGLSRQERRRLRAMAHRLRGQEAKGDVDPELAAHFQGKLSYLAMLNPSQADRIRARR